jgi:C4-dicarboxylate transporter, DctM subunit
MSEEVQRPVILSSGWVLLIMAALFLGLGYLGVPVPFAIMAGVFTATMLTPVSMQSMVGQLFNGLDAEALLAVPFFLLVGELMTSADVTRRMIVLAQTLVGHLRGGLAQVVTLFSMFFAGISGSSTADVAVLSRTVAPEMDREGYGRGFTAALIASASTIANLIPPSIMAVVYGATGNVSIAGLFLGGVVPGVLIGIGLMIYSYFFGPTGIMRRRATLRELAGAVRGAALPLVIPVIIMGGILGGWFTPTEAGLAAVVYIVLIVVPALRPGHIQNLPRDFMHAGLLYAIPMAAVAGASAFGWMLAYLRGPDVVADWIAETAGTDPRTIMFLLVVLFVIVGDFVDAVPAIIIFMPIIIRLVELGDINPVHMGVTIITTLVFGLLTPPYGLSLLMASKFCGVKFTTAMYASLPLYLVFFATIAFCVFFPDVVLWLPKQVLPQSVGCFPNPSGEGYICP